MEPNFLEDRLANLADCNGDVDDDYDSNYDVIMKLMNIVNPKSAFHLVNKVPNYDHAVMHEYIHYTYKECMLLLTEHNSEGFKHCLSQN